VSAQDPDHYTYGIGFALNLPNTWFGRFEMMGGSGTDGSLNADPTGSAGVELTNGWAVAADDGGHEDNPANQVGGYQDDDPNAGGAQHFGVDHQARIDYGYNGIEKTAKISKQIIAEYYGRAVDSSYLMGCSNGGRDGMVASQKFPDLFDGIVSQNPGFNLPQAGIAEAWNEQALAPLFSAPAMLSTALSTGSSMTTRLAQTIRCSQRWTPSPVARASTAARRMAEHASPPRRWAH
jgi:feruloyl esterase